VGLVSGFTTVRIANTTFYQRVTLSGTGLAASASNSVEPSEKSLASPDGGGFPTRYKLVDLGTLGGPIGYGSLSGDGMRLLAQNGTVTSFADTSNPDPFAPDFCNVPDCLTTHGYRWKHGEKTELGALDNRFNSVAGSINERGWIAGATQTGILDPSSGFPQNRAALWKQDNSLQIVEPVAGGNESIGIYVNNAGQFVGLSDSDIPDPFSIFGAGVAIRTFMWEKGVARDIGTLGGPDAASGANCDNQRPNQIVGFSYTSFTPNDSTGVPTADPFLYRDGQMIDLGTLGGTFGFGQCANNHGDVIGSSNLEGDLTFHAFRWRKGVMKDLGTLGGDNSEAIWINNAGEIAGSADLPGINLHDAVVWKDGHIIDLGTIGTDACSRGRGINSRGQVVGGSSDCANFLHAFVWNGSGPMLDLNTLIAPGSGVQLTNAININDRGEILAKSDPVGVTPIDDEDFGHLVLLIPCHAGDEDAQCKAEEVLASDVTQTPISKVRNVPAVLPARPQTAKEAVAILRERLRKQYWVPALKTK
jgi:probable HAF family extracellular repeat protein